MKLLTNQGTIVIRLDPTAAPCTVNSFYFLSKKNFFDNTVCHRLATLRSDRLDLLQCGDPLAGHHAKNDSDGSGGPGYLFNDENLGPAYKRGVVFMAHNAGIAHSNGSQFVISYSDETARLQKDYTPFGVVIEGLNVVDKIAAGGISAKKGEADIYLDGDGSNAPKMRVVIEDVTVE